MFLGEGEFVMWLLSEETAGVFQQTSPEVQTDLPTLSVPRDSLPNRRPCRGLSQVLRTAVQDMVREDALC